MSRGLPSHLRDLDRLLELGPERVLPAHGDPEAIAAGGYWPGAARRHQDYIRLLQRSRSEPRLRGAPLRELLAPAAARRAGLATSSPTRTVHRENVATVLAAG